MKFFARSQALLALALAGLPYLASARPVNESAVLQARGMYPCPEFLAIQVDLILT